MLYIVPSNTSLTRPLHRSPYTGTALHPLHFTDSPRTIERRISRMSPTPKLTCERVSPTRSVGSVVT